jgi:carboxyl-terminal processing protease
MRMFGACGRFGVNNKAAVMSAVLVASLAGVAGSALARQAAVDQQAVAVAARPAEAISLFDTWSTRVWTSATRERGRTLESLLGKFPVEDVAQRAASPGFSAMTTTVASLNQNLAKRETTRAERVAELEKELDESLADLSTDLKTSKALRAAIELEMLVQHNDEFLSQPRIQTLIEKASAAAQDAEARGEWLMANELYMRLDALLEDWGTNKKAAERQARRLAMIRLYAPEKFWEHRNRRQLLEKPEPLPKFKAANDDFRQRLRGVDERMVVGATLIAARNHIDQSGVKPLIQGGLEALRTFATTTDLKEAFPKLGDEAATREFLRVVDDFTTAVDASTRRLDAGEVSRMLDSLEAANRRTINIPNEALLHEFGNGAMATLDDFTAVIWPDELARFERATQSSFIGVGIRIEYDELLNVRVVTPLEGMPAYRAGIQAGDVIKSVNGENIYGATLDQAVELITGPVNSQVTLTIEREAEDKQKTTQDYTLTRSKIQVRSAAGWKRTGARGEDWDWFVDPINKIGYIRLSQFTETTTQEFDAAVRELKANGMNSLILDLRYNPGGYLDEAISMSGRFVPQGQVVGTRGPSGQVEEWHRVNRQATVADIPVAVLINEGSASASEIVAGAIRHYAHQGDIDAVIVGQRTFGKGSVQVVSGLAGNLARMKLTTQYYTLPDGKVIHRLPHAKEWGVEPDVAVDMLPSQISKALDIRKAADIIPTDANGNPLPDGKTEDPAKLFSEGADVQLQTAVVLLQARTLSGGAAPAPAAPANPNATVQADRPASVR